MQERYAILAAVVLVIAAAFFIHTEQPVVKALNYGGGAYIQLQEENAVFTAGEKLMLDPKMMLYLGSGWDNACYKGLIGYAVENEIGQTVGGNRLDFGTVDHDADTRNRPVEYVFDEKLDTTGYAPGVYRMEARAYLGPISNRPSNGECSTNGLFDDAVANTDAVQSFGDNEAAWLERFSQNAQITTTGKDVKVFVIKEQQPVGWWDRIVAWFTVTFSGLRWV